jgi:glycerol-3-phosphate acyltransferase PlsX
MAEGITIAIDSMGGDHAPEIVLDGVEIAAQVHPGVRFAVHGPEERLKTLLAARTYAARVTSVHRADGVVAMDAKPSQAMRQGRGSSMWNAIAAVENGEAQAVVSAGNTGALMAIGMLRLRMTPGIARPALVASWPTLNGYSAVLDVGATVEADATQLADYCIMGEAFYRAVYGKARPTVGLLNVGSEDQKGHEEIRTAAKMLREGGIDLDFYGFVEGDDISQGVVDVVVTDGFSGNIALKTAEGTARLVSTFLKDALTSGPFAMMGALIARRALLQLRNRMDPRAVNGGVFLGLNGLVVKSHGGTDGRGFAAAINVAVRMAQSRFREEVAASLKRLNAAEAAPEPAAGAH